jgi:formylglycine-generating enzyme required for sulfatase activity
VGLYPQGMSPVRAHDMSGNVLEWCLNEHEKPDRIDVAGDAGRAVRGGSWSDSQYFAHCADRYHYDLSPLSRRHYLGFRLLCSSPIF